MTGCGLRLAGTTEACLLREEKEKQEIKLSNLTIQTGKCEFVPLFPEWNVYFSKNIKAC